MRTKKSQNQKTLERSLKHIDEMSILSLMDYMKSVVLQKFDQERMAVLRFQLTGYDDTPLSNLDKVRNKFEEVYDREFEKIYNQKKTEYEKRNQI